MGHAGRRVLIDSVARLVEWKLAAQQHRLLDRRRIASRALAVIIETLDLVAEHLGRAERIPHLRMPSDDSESHILAARADHDRWMRLLQRLRLEARVAQLMIPPAEVRALVGPQLLDDLDR